MSVESDARFKVIEKVMKKMGYERSALIETLHSAQETFGYLEPTTLKYVAKRLRLPYSKVYGVATFYHYFRLKPKGEHNVVVCMGTACYIKGANKILEKIEQKYNVKAGETTKDNLLSLLTARCVGTCSLAPVVVYDGKSKGKLEVEESMEILKETLS